MMHIIYNTYKILKWLLDDYRLKDYYNKVVFTFFTVKGLKSNSL